MGTEPTPKMSYKKYTKATNSVQHYCGEFEPWSELVTTNDV
jgi:hypothetical protein